MLADNGNSIILLFRVNDKNSCTVYMRCEHRYTEEKLHGSSSIISDKNISCLSQPCYKKWLLFLFSEERRVGGRENADPCPQSKLILRRRGVFINAKDAIYADHWAIFLYLGSRLICFCCAALGWVMRSLQLWELSFWTFFILPDKIEHIFSWC